MNEKQFAGKTYAVIGLARAGIPAARFLAACGARVFGYDNRTLEELSDEARALPDRARRGATIAARLRRGVGVALAPVVLEAVRGHGCLATLALQVRIVRVKRG